MSRMRLVLAAIIAVALTTAGMFAVAAVHPDAGAASVSVVAPQGAAPQQLISGSAVEVLAQVDVSDRALSHRVRHEFARLTGAVTETAAPHHKTAHTATFCPPPFTLLGGEVITPECHTFTTTY